ncbi:MAG TPA: bifunctional indole-3-glycerol-phosphate synthase TrpC/phosphoribosylanthranilate isomerase TrpF [Sphingomicrobium sp.]
MAEGLLGDIAAVKREELELRFDGVSLDALRARAARTQLSLGQSMAKSGARFILEIKKASPSAGAIRPCADVRGLARRYRGVADALSVLTDCSFFRGTVEDLAAARDEFDGPILAKDFFLDARQVAEARIAGADAILVMLSLLDDARAREMIAEARRFGMDALVEVHDEAEMRRALALGASLIGINNRDLRDLSVDLATTERLARLAPGRILVSESGISARTDVDRLAGRVDGFLIGSSLMRAADPADAARALIFGRVKLCGLNRPEDFECAQPATHVGLIFVPESPRAVSVAEALRLPRHPQPVGVFRNAAIGEVAEAATLLGLAAVQLHGDEDASYARALARRLPSGCEMWKALDPGNGRQPTFDAADRLLFDSGAGGTGRSFDWKLVEKHPDLATSLVAGGIGAHNAREAQRLGAYAIDVGSAVEDSPGRKSARKIAQLFDALRPACREPVAACA